MARCHVVHQQFGSGIFPAVLRNKPQQTFDLSNITLNGLRKPGLGLVGKDVFFTAFHC